MVGRALEAAGLALLALPALALALHVHPSAHAQLLAAAGFAVVAYIATSVLVPHFSWYLERRGLKGKDMGRRGTPDEHKEMCGARAQLVDIARARAHARARA